MSYLNLPKGITAFSKAVISFWFRVPKETLDATAAAFSGGPYMDIVQPPFDGVTPLVVFGDDTVTGYDISSSSVPGGEYTIEGWWKISTDDSDKRFRMDTPASHGFGYPFFRDRPTDNYVLGFARPRDPCYIGIYCNKGSITGFDTTVDDGAPANVLRINLQMSDMGSGSGRDLYVATNEGPDLEVRFLGQETDIFPVADRTGTLVFLDPPGVACIKEYNPIVVNLTYSDATQTVGLPAETEWFFIKLPNQEVTPDQWHHVLISFDMQPITAEGRLNDAPDQGTITTSGRIWVALDDVNYSGDDLLGGSYDSENTQKPGDNDLFSQNAVWVARNNNNLPLTEGPFPGEGYVETINRFGVVPPTYSYAPGGIEANAHPIGIPATPKYVDAVRWVEMAELQIFTDVTLDTGIEANRRAFIDYKRDAHGTPVADKNGNLFLQPVDPTKPAWNNPPGDLRPPAEVLLGKKADIILHGVKNWKAGKNTGTTGVTVDPTTGKTTTIPAGQFAHVGKIVKYTPDPGLPPGKQGAPQ